MSVECQAGSAHVGSEQIANLAHVCVTGFLGVWGTPNVTGYIHNAARDAATAPSPGVIYTTTEYSPPAYFEGKLMAVSL